MLWNEKVGNFSNLTADAIREIVFLLVQAA
jgi:hypothetical protein